MMLGGLPDFENPQKQIGQATDMEARITELEKQVKWQKWAIIFLIVYIIWKDTK